MNAATWLSRNRTKLYVPSVALLVGSVVYLNILLHEAALSQGTTIGAEALWATVAGLVSMTFLLTSIYLGNRSKAQRAKRLQSTLEAIGQGDLTQTIQDEIDDEFGRMGRSVNELAQTLRKNVEEMESTSASLSSSARELAEVSQRMDNDSTVASQEMTGISERTDSVNTQVHSLATGIEEFGVSIQEISKNAAEGANVASTAVSVAREANDTVAELGESSTEIGNVLKVITSIAEQTNLLALNATIEAARAGEAGKGFAVVANEVKELAKETANATEDISSKIDNIQSNTTRAIQAISRIGEIIDQINDFQASIAGAVEEQNVTVSVLGSTIGEAATSSSEISASIISVVAASEGTSEGAAQAQVQAAHQLEMASQLQGLIQRFKIEA